ncbi:hypothetical protein IAD21_00483 [Abditibacteriota bacterium]|nr:hypothetical protein IAD21_00483 [Abditibacteriota bacterium]
MARISDFMMPNVSGWSQYMVHYAILFVVQPSLPRCRPNWMPRLIKLQTF